MRYAAGLLYFFFWLTNQVSAQICTAPGQTPASAVFVCGSTSLRVTTPTFCGQTSVPIPCGDGYPYRDINPNFFRMYCSSGGTLGFIIAPESAGVNYSWALFDITNTNPVDIFTNASLLVACNWSGELGETGASVDGTDLIVCSGAQPLFSQMPDIFAGHTYLLMVCNESASPGAYQLTFEGGSATISDPVAPHLLAAGPNCNGTIIWVKLTKPVDCNTVAGDGSDFIIAGGPPIVSAYPGFCFTPFGSDSVFLVTAQPVSNGTHTVTIQNGSDGNTLADICGSLVPETENFSFLVSPPRPTPMDSIKPVGCTQGYIDLVFKKRIDCGSIDASDFMITGPQPVTPEFVSNGCSNGEYTNLIRLKLFDSTVTAGNYQVQLVSGTDGNTLLDECGLESPAGATLSFEVKEFVVADFNYDIPPSCGATTVSFFHNGAHNVSQWAWDFGNGNSSSVQNPVQVFVKPGNYKVTLTVDNGSCTDTQTKTISAGGYLLASFEAPKIACPGDTIRLTNNSTGNIDQWRWDFGNGMSSTLKNPALVRYADIGRENFYTVRLFAINSQVPCADSTARVIRVLGNCFIAVPSAFTPNGDGRNDFLYPVNALKADKLEFRVYDRFGQLVFASNDWTRKWDGTRKGTPLPTGVYVWLLRYVQRETKEPVFLRGTTVLLR